MLIAYDSRTGNVERFVRKLSVKNVKIHNGIWIEEPYFLITYTTKFGEVPSSTSEFLLHNHVNMVGVASSGNIVWGSNYAKAADIISEQYNVPIIHKFELSGTNEDVEKIMQEVQRFG